MPASTFGRYELLELLATGGMGEVYLAVDRGSPGAHTAYRKPCVVKRILPEMSTDAEVAAMFAREAAFAAQLSHANVVQVHDHGMIEGRPYTAMEFVHGINTKMLLDLQRKTGRAPPDPVVVHVAGGVAAALAYAHHKAGWDGTPLRLVHRDVSPHNVLLSVSGEVKLADFGMVKGAGFKGVYQTTENTLRGKLAYMSPEQASGAPLDGRSDIFSWAVVTYELLTLSHPFAQDAEGLDLLDRIKRAAHVPLRQVRPDLPAPLLDVVADCLRQDPADRPASSQVLQERWEAVRAGFFPQAGNPALAQHLASLSVPPLSGSVVDALTHAAPTTVEAVRPVAHTTLSGSPINTARATQEAAAPVRARNTISESWLAAPQSPAAAAAVDPGSDPVLSLGRRNGGVLAVTLAALLLSALLGGLWALQAPAEDPAQPPAPPQPNAGPPAPSAGQSNAVPPANDAPRARPVPRARRRAMRAAVDEALAPLGASGGASQEPPAEHAPAEVPSSPSTAEPPPEPAPEPAATPAAAAAPARSLAPPASPGLPPKAGVRFNARRPVTVLVDGTQRAQALQGQVGLADHGLQTVRVVWGVHFLTLRVDGLTGERRTYMETNLAQTVVLEGRPLGAGQWTGLPRRGGLFLVGTPDNALSLTLR